MTLGLVVSLVPLLSACGAGAEGEDSIVDREVQPTAEAPESLGPITEQPRDTRVVEGNGFSLFAPAEFQQSSRQGPEDIQMLVLGKPSDEPGGVIEVIAFSNTEPTSSIDEQLTVLAAQKTELEGVDEFTRESIEWPGAADASIVQWTEKTSTAGGPIDQTFAQLSVQVSDRLITTVVAVAPEEEFEASGVLDVLRSLTLDSA